MKTATAATRVQKQKTLKSAINCSGVGLHSGDKVIMTLHPAAPGTGIVFRRTDVAGKGAVIPATWKYAVESPLCTTLVKDGVKIATIEHLMSALAGFGIDNCTIDISAGEVPVMDGSAAPFVFLIECAGVLEQNAPKRAIRILKEIRDDEENRSGILSPGEDFSVSFSIDFESQAIGRQELYMEVRANRYKQEISRARTFGFLHEVDQMRKMGLARGGSLDNAIVINGDEIMNESGLRYANEFVRHKILDSIGDLYLAGAPIIGHYHGIRTGHAQTYRLVHKLMNDNSAWEWATLPIQAVTASRSSFTVPERAVAATA
ncbi:UDP-3-O-acyl-N-acetylglucosamine deacetylase [Kiloniella laminariae]|uniref:UDP-3-O-acyl-N-acetylglucosamine deacetylase n=1 Tax=Kiloniella laminariae TaxID=454162 RepID=UPI00037F851E|nr:UDP-3-O-acyl-N-acetylglucosamine deacetylase [Kiloniella laminariae]